jgi:hypothetical protein
VRDEAPFSEVPSGTSIARYFWEETERRNNGCDGIDLYRDGGDYCYLWVTAMIDLDMWHAYLLDVRTHVGVEPGKIGETRDYLFLFAGAGGRFDVQWRNQPIDFGAPTDEHRDRLRAGMHWLASLTEKAIEDAEEAR